MLRKKGRDANMKFLFGSVFFFFIIIVVIALFVYASLQEYWNKPNRVVQGYEIVFAPDFAHTEYDVWLNDSLLYSGAPVNADTVVRFNRFAEENALLVVERGTQLVSILPVNKRSGRLFLYFAGDGSVALEE